MIDALVAHKVPAPSPAVVIAIDEQTFRTPPFRDVPYVTWTPQFAQIVDAVLAGGAKVVGFDAVFPTSIDSLVPGHDRAFLETLMRGGRAGRIVLGKVQHRSTPISPFPGQVFAVGGLANIRALNVLEDPDGVIRRLPLLFQRQADQPPSEPSMALELASRALGTRPIRAADGSLKLGDYVIPQSPENAMLVHFGAGQQDIPTYSIADLYACATGDHADYFAREFADKVVLFGMVADVEDRKITAKRYITTLGQPAQTARCALPVSDILGGNGAARQSIPGVYIHAQAVDDLIDRQVLQAVGKWPMRAVMFALTLIAGLLTLRLSPAASMAAAGAIALGIVGGSAALFGHGYVLPMLDIVFSVVLGFGVMVAYRFGVIDRERRRVRRAFSLYMAPSVVDRMLATGSLPQLGGERREMTFMFTDIADFTTLSEGMDPGALSDLLNTYFELINETVMAHGGLVNEFLGDGTLSFFGAPFDVADHAARAVACTRELIGKTDRFSEEMKAKGIAFGLTRIGVHSGPVIVGNFGASQRMKYSALGDTVNAASRLEGLNKYLGTQACLSEQVAEQVDPATLRAIGTVQVKGRRGELTIYEPIENGRFAADYLTRYHQAYDLLDHGDAQHAADLFRQLLIDRPDDRVVAMHAKRLADGQTGRVITMTEK